MQTKMLFLTKAGSHLYGTNIATSDQDVRGVCYPPFDTIFGLQKFEQRDGGWNDDIDRTIYSLPTFFKLALENNPNIIELLFANNPKTNILVTSEWTELVYGNRKKFLSKDAIANRFIGYATSQYHKMSQHVDWIKTPPTKPNPADFGYKNDTWTDYPSKVKYDAALKTFQNYTDWIKNRNDVRLDLELKFGYDTKAGMHLVRILSEGIMLLADGDLEFPLHNAPELLKIRAGEWEYVRLEDFFTEAKTRLEQLKSTSSLPAKADFDFVNSIYKALMLRHLGTFFLDNFNIGPLVEV